MKSKYRFRRILSGVMAAVTILSTVISPLTVYASEEPKAAEPPAYESVKDQLDENEVVKATDLELEVGQDFDVSTDFTNLEIKDESKVKVTFQRMTPGRTSAPAMQTLTMPFIMWSQSTRTTRFIRLGET